MKIPGATFSSFGSLNSLTLFITDILLVRQLEIRCFLNCPSKINNTAGVGGRSGRFCTTPSLNQLCRINTELLNGDIQRTHILSSF